MPALCFDKLGMSGVQFGGIKMGRVCYQPYPQPRSS
jgi:hypothetical protein